jgi:hypothetical protein
VAGILAPSFDVGNPTELLFTKAVANVAISQQIGWVCGIVFERAIVERTLEAELTTHLRYDKPFLDGQGERRGRQASFEEPNLLNLSLKGETRFAGFDNRIPSGHKSPQKTRQQKYDTMMAERSSR